MHTKQQEQQFKGYQNFLVNGIKCELSIDRECFSWTPINNKKYDAGQVRPIKRVNFAQIIGFRRWLPLDMRHIDHCIEATENDNNNIVIEKSEESEHESYDCQKSNGSSCSMRRSFFDCKKGDKIKVYYSKQNENKSSCQLLKLKKLIIEPANCFSKGLEGLAKQIEASLKPRREHRPKRLLVFVNPFGGKGRASQLYESQVSRLLDVAGVEAKLVVTKYANHARDTIEDPLFDVELFDGIVCVGGDGMFSELMNGLLFRYNRDQILMAELKLKAGSGKDGCHTQEDHSKLSANNNDCNNISENQQQLVMPTNDSNSNNNNDTNSNNIGDIERLKERQLVELRLALGGIGQQFISPPIPLGVIGAGSTDANSFGLIGTNDVITATLNIILGNQIKIDVCSVHSIKEDRLLRFVSTFVAYGYFGDVIRESEKLRWLGPSRYDVTGFNNLIKNRAYKGSVRILISGEDGSPQDLAKCHANCEQCYLSTNSDVVYQGQLEPATPCDLDFKLIEKRGHFVGVNAAITACRCPQTKKGFSPNNHLANGCADLILVRPCSRIQYIRYLLRTGWTKKSAFDLKYVEAYRCRQFEFETQESRLAVESSNSSTSSSSTSSSSGSVIPDQDSCSSWNADGEILNEQSVRVKVNNRLLKVFGTGEPSHYHDK